MKKKLNIKSSESKLELKLREEFFELYKKNPIPNDQVLSNLGLFLNSKNMSRLLFFDYLYKLNLETQGTIMEFGVRWGQNLSIFSALRGIYEPFNRHRKIIGFDTFKGFPSIHPKDGKSSLMKKGQLDLTKNYEKFLEKIMEFQENDNPISHLKKFEICKGDAKKELLKYLKRNPETIVSLAYFDLDLYKPTKECLDVIKSRLVKGSVIGFDELNDPDSPGETLALMETLGLNNIKLKRFKFSSRVSYFVFE
tara:strand:+ start:94 stop:849 length:756 start_codon:yes stop_codon:yes gene_type:complete